MSKLHSFCLVVVTLALLLASITYAATLLLRVQEHNLAVHTQVRLCAQDFDGDAAKKCSDAARGYAVKLW